MDNKMEKIEIDLKGANIYNILLPDNRAKIVVVSGRKNRKNEYFVRYEVYCFICDERLIVDEHNLNHRDWHFCSRICYHEFRGLKNKNGKYIECKYCSEEIYRNNFWLNKRKNHFCSPKCSQLYHSGENHKDYGIKGKEHFNYNRITLMCLNCEEEFDRIPYTVNKGQYKFCSKPCSHEYLGNVSPNYNKKACEFFKWLNKMFNLNGFHAENDNEYYIKELGYYPDYYEPDLNFIIEWDEPGHYDKNGNLNKKDQIRQEKIESYLNCDFYRIKENRNNNAEIINFLADFGTKKMYK